LLGSPPFSHWLPETRVEPDAQPLVQIWEQMTVLSNVSRIVEWTKPFLNLLLMHAPGR
jgi:hypothetical protein